MKFLVTFCLIASLAAVAIAGSASWGKRQSQDYLLYRENVVRNQINSNYWNVNVAFPPSGQINNKNITAIYVYDRFTNSSGAQPTLYSGGPGNKHATINLKSQFSRGINSTVEIYGK